MPERGSNHRSNPNSEFTFRLFFFFATCSHTHTSHLRSTEITQNHPSPRRCN